jgi:enoyl-CoA hydratase
MSGTIAVEKDGAIAILRFVNDDRALMDDGTEAAFGPALDAVENDTAIRAVILTGAHAGVFIRHFDLRILEARGRHLVVRGKLFTPERPVPETPLHVAFRRIDESAKPYICAINGTAMGGGFELALCCDLRLAEDGPYALGLPEINAGLLPGAGGTQRLTRAIGPAAALEWLLLGKTVAPREAAARGLVHECVSGPVLPRALEIARQLAEKPPRAIAHIKRLVRMTAHASPENALAVERTLFCDLMTSPEALEAMAAINGGKRDLRGAVQ